MTTAFAFLLLLLVGAPIGFILVASAGILIWSGGNEILLQGLPQQLYAGIETPSMLALPLFILLGELMGIGGIGRRLLALAMAVMLPVRAGLAYVNLLANLMLASVLGSTVAQLTVMSRLAVPEMEKEGYGRDMAATITSAGSLLSPVLPPSINLIVFAAVAQLPVADLFKAAIGPALGLTFAFALVIAWMGWKYKLPKVANPPLRQRVTTAIRAIPAVLVPLVAIGSIMTGIATPTEAAALASIAAVIVGGLIYRELKIAALPGAFARAALISGTVLYLVAGAQILGWVMTFSNIPAQAAELIQSMAGSPLMFLILLNILLLLLGTVLEPIPAIILTAPVLLPVASGVYGIDPLMFGVILCLNLALGLLTPPVGAGLYTASLMTCVSAGRLSWLLIPFFGAVLAVLAALTLMEGLGAVLKG